MILKRSKTCKQIKVKKLLKKLFHVFWIWILFLMVENHIVNAIVMYHQSLKRQMIETTRTNNLLGIEWPYKIVYGDSLTEQVVLLFKLIDSRYTIWPGYMSIDYDFHHKRLFMINFDRFLINQSIFLSMMLFYVRLYLSTWKIYKI